MDQRSVSEILAASQEPGVDAIIVIDREGLIQAFDSSAQLLFGYTLAEVIHQPLIMLMPDKQKQTHPAYLQRAVNRENNPTQLLHLEQTIIGLHKSGSWMPLAITVSADNSGEDIRFTGVIQDLRKHEARINRLYQDFQANTEALNQRIKFESILNEYGNQFLSCGDDQFYLAMEKALQEIAQFLNLDHSYILQLSEDMSQAHLCSEWRRSISLMKPLPESFSLPNSQTIYQAFTKDQTIVLNKNSQKEHKGLYQLAQQLSPNGFLTTHITPIYREQNVLAGCIGFSTLDDHHQLNTTQQSLLSLATQQLINAWGRHQLILIAREAHNKIRTKNKQLANKAAFSNALLRSSNLLYLASQNEFHSNVTEVLLQASLISGHQQAVVHIDFNKAPQLKGFLHHFFELGLLSQEGYPLLIRHITEQLKSQDSVQFSQQELTSFPKDLQQEIKQRQIQILTAVKLSRGEDCFGFICFFSSQSQLNRNEENIRFLQLTGQNLTSAIQHHAIQFDLELSEQKLKSANQLLSQQALQDTLTELPNRRAFDHSILQEFDRAKRYQSNLTILMCDIDYFKLYNDHYGHPQGDICLQQIAKVMLHTFNRAGELCARFGGEEFAIILPSISASEAQQQAQKLIDNLANRQIKHAPSSQQKFVSLSIGIAQFPTSDLYAKHLDLIEAADQALYLAKNNGRNQLAWAVEAE